MTTDQQAKREADAILAKFPGDMLARNVVEDLLQAAFYAGRVSVYLESTERMLFETKQRKERPHA